ncbi:FAD-dependent monooxygenase [Dactylosporangium fulvum]|uniref:FAD-dependent monooxygenase n=1 Tax=Dactylosporangium fulvum TaxID=53359 RepID=A0ABY5WAS7_9ACTN|nr:FAD-dependent monooxygenase [Dactylosporangium fulvum]UWP87160.1 FAD-dependent monooxygenase [Dactylosporangium fulvum]
MKVLISGASVAGPALAYWLRHHGATPTVVERAPAPRTSGQAIDVRGAALTVVERMGLLEPLRAVRTRMRGSSMVDGDGTELWRSTEYAPSSGRFDSPDLEVLREDLTGLLAERTAGVEYRYGDEITGLRQDPDGVDVRFAGGGAERFDLVVGADGLHSEVRRRTFGDESQFVRHLDTYLAVFSADNVLGLDNWQVWVRNDTAGAGVYPARDNTELRVNVGFRSALLRFDRRDLDAQRSLVAERAAGLGWEIPRLLKAMWQAPDFYFDAMAQVHLPTWSRGRVTLVGDAGYCPSPLSGQGTSLALVGAYVLAAELAAGDHVTALTRYEERMRPFVTRNQALATKNADGPAPEASMDGAKDAISL